MTAIYSLQKPCRVWSADRKVRKSVFASSLLELKLKGSEKLGYESIENVSSLKIVLESDGTEIEDDGYFQTIDKNTIFILLRSNESWLPLGVDALKSALLTLPGLVSDSLNKLEASDRLPNWKISDHSGIITVVLSWDTRDRQHSESPFVSAPPYLEQEIMDSLGWTSPATASQTGREGAQTDHGHQQQQPSTSGAMMQEQQQQLLQQIERQQQKILQQQQLLANATVSSQQQPSAQQSTRSRLTLKGLSPVTGLPSGHDGRAPRVIPTIQHQYVSFDSDSDQDMSDKDEETSPIHEGHTHCDFHCSNLHRRMRLIKKCSVATSPIREAIHFGPFGSSSGPSWSSSRGASPSRKKIGPSAPKYVRFSGVEGKNRATVTGPGGTGTLLIESDMMDEDQFGERYLLVIERFVPIVGGGGLNTNFTMKDVGIILEKLCFKIVYVEKLGREKESSDVYNWIIRA